MNLPIFLMLLVNLLSWKVATSGIDSRTKPFRALERSLQRSQRYLFAPSSLSIAKKLETPSMRELARWHSWLFICISYDVEVVVTFVCYRLMVAAQTLNARFYNSSEAAEHLRLSDLAFILLAIFA